MVRIAALAVALSLGLGDGALAAPVTYSFATGSADITVSAGATPITDTLTPPSLAFNGLFATFDDGTIDLIDFSFSVVPGQTIPLLVPYGGKSRIRTIHP